MEITNLGQLLNRYLDRNDFMRIVNRRAEEYKRELKDMADEAMREVDDILGIRLPS